MAAAPVGSERISSRAVSAFMATSSSISRLRATYPCLLARMVYQVGNPAMLEGNRFFPLTGIPIPKMLLSRTRLADCEPEPFTVATWMLKSLMTRLDVGVCSAAELPAPGAPTATSPVAIWPDSFPDGLSGTIRRPDLCYLSGIKKDPDLRSQHYSSVIGPVLTCGA